MFTRFLIAAALIATPTLAQEEAPPADGSFVMHVAVNSDRTTRVSFGRLSVSETGAAVTLRREGGAQCAWNPAADLPVEQADVTVVRPPPGIETAEQFGTYVATLYSAIAAYKGGEPSAEQHGCVRVLMTNMAQRALQSEQGQAQPGQ
jgi:hypothetical protein